MQRTYFKEEQKFTQVWLWVLLIISITAAILPYAVLLFEGLIKSKPYGEKPTFDDSVLITFIVTLLVSIGIIVLFWKTKLITEVKTDGIYLRFPPFFFKDKVFGTDEIETYEIRQYKAVREYGGWGIRHGGSGKAYNVRGNIGLQLGFRNSKKLLIGTQRKDALLRAMNKMIKSE